MLLLTRFLSVVSLSFLLYSFTGFTVFSSRGASGTIHFYGSVVSPTCYLQQKGDKVISQCHSGNQNQQTTVQLIHGNKKINFKNPNVSNSHVRWFKRNPLTIAMVSLNYL